MSRIEGALGAWALGAAVAAFSAGRAEAAVQTSERFPSGAEEFLPWAPSGAASAPSPGWLAQARIAMLADNLGNSAFRTRQKAQSELYSIGLPALPALRRVSAAGDPEAQARARRLRERLAWDALEPGGDLARAGEGLYRQIGGALRATGAERVARFERLLETVEAPLFGSFTTEEIAGVERTLRQDVERMLHPEEVASDETLARLAAARAKLSPLAVFLEGPRRARMGLIHALAASTAEEDRARARSMLAELVANNPDAEPASLRSWGPYQTFRAAVQGLRAWEDPALREALLKRPNGQAYLDGYRDGKLRDDQVPEP